MTASRSLFLLSLVVMVSFVLANDPPHTPDQHTVTPAATKEGSPSGPVQINKKLIDAPLDDIQWADSTTVFVLSEQGVLYRSVDSGKAWTNQASKLHAASATPSVRSMHISRSDPNKIFFIGHGRENWYTLDMGNKYTSLPKIHTLSSAYSNGEPLDLYEVRLHPTQSNWILGASMSEGCQQDPKENCYKILWVSKDFGATWKQSTTYVVQFDWAPTATSVRPVKTPLHSEIAGKTHVDTTPSHDDDLVYATIHTVKTGNQVFGVWDKNIHFFQSWDYFKTEKRLVEHGNRFLFGDYNYLFVAAVNPHQETEVSLQVSKDDGSDKRFKTAILPVELTEHSYTILDTSEGSVFLHVNHAPFDLNAPTGHVYVSDWSGTQFSLSLPYNHRSADGKCDFEKVEGLEGIYLANFIDDSDIGKDGLVKEEWDETNTDNSHNSAGGAGKKKLKAKTVITFDKGGIWSYLEPPAVDINGKPIKCVKDCHLHLHGITDLYGPFYSSATATGIIMATGTVGSFLQESNDQINTYLSRDAGLTWFEVAKGSHIYEFGDHGGLIVMAYDEGSTDSIMFSWDQGVSWKTLKISDTPIQVENIIIEPEATSTHFIVYGWQDDSVGVMIYIDFSELHEMTACQGHDAPDTPNSDYETWSPSDGRLGGKCLLGHKVSYTRRKRTSQCFNPEKHERVTFIENCPCTEEDFECDYGFKRKFDGGECVHDPDARPLPDEPCRDFHYVTKGYRRVAGDTCTNGAQWDRVQMSCLFARTGHFGTILLVCLALVVLALGVATFYGKLEFVEDLVDWVKAKLKKSDYVPVGRQAPHSAVDDDFGIDSEEYGQSAHLMRDDPVEKDDEDTSTDKKKKSKKGKAKDKDAELDMEEFNPRAK